MKGATWVKLKVLKKQKIKVNFIVLKKNVLLKRKGRLKIGILLELY
jgi:hypothetical protein